MSQQTQAGLSAPEFCVGAFDPDGVAPRIAQDLNRFLDDIEADRTIYPKSIRTVSSGVAEMVERIAQACGLNGRRGT